MCCNTSVEASAKISFLERVCNTKFAKKNFFSFFDNPAASREWYFFFLLTFFATSLKLSGCRGWDTSVLSSTKKKTQALPSSLSWWDIKPVARQCWPLWEHSVRFKATGSHQRVIAEPLPLCIHSGEHGKIGAAATHFSPL